MTLLRVRNLAVLGAAAAMLVAASVLASPATAATIAPIYDLDQSINDANCSLREAITSANNNSNGHEDACAAGEPSPAVDIIDLQATGYEILGTGDNTNVTGDFDINAGGGPLIIDGSGTLGNIGTSIDANDVDRIFDVDGDPGLANPVTIRGIILDDAQVSDAAGGTILMGAADLTLNNVVVQNGRVNGANANLMRGAGLAAMGQGKLTIREGDFNDNAINAAAAGAGTARGGAIHIGSTTSANIDRSSISGDNGLVGDGTGAGDAQILRGAGISMIDAARDVTITNSLIAANGMVNGDLHQGGGIDWDELGDDDLLRLTNVTFSGNFVGSAAGNNGGAIYADGDAMIAHTTIGPHTGFAGAGVFVGSGPVQVRNSLIETGTTADCGGAEPAISLGYNIERGPSQDCPFNQPTDQLPDQPLMDPLDDNGGPWQTHQVAFAFEDQIPQASCLGADGAPLTRDQRNAPRPGQNSGAAMCEPGAYEFNRCGPGTLVKIVGSEGNDQLIGTAGADGIMGMGGSDTIEGGDGVDGMCGGDGADVFPENLQDADTDFFRGEGGSDTLDFSLFANPVTLNLAITVSQMAGAGLGNTSQNTIENATGGPQGDALTGNAAMNTLLGLGGNDGLFSRDGIADVVDCGAGTGDTAQTDQLSLDFVVNCEAIDALPEPPVITPITPITPQVNPTVTTTKKKCKKKRAAAAKKCKRKR